MSFFKTHTNCKIINGKKRSIIIDLQRQNYTLIPNAMLDIIERLNNRVSIITLKSIYGLENEKIIDEYLDFLISNEFGIYIDYDEFNFFPELNNNFEISSHISNVIVEICDFNVSKLKNIIESLENLMCRNIQFISYKEIDVKIIKNILIETKNTNFRSIELILHYSEDLFKFIKDIDKYNFRITELLIHGALNRNKIAENTSFNIIFKDHIINNFTHCGKIDSSFHSVNKEKVLESLNHNSCLHKKISIDKHGYIRNCPSMPQHFGNIKDTTLEEALNHPSFKKYWNVTKDMIAVCKDCEFRHICTDCRAYTERTHFQEDIDLSKPLKCGYNPYTNEWAEWSTNPLKKKAIEYYGMQELVKKDA